jgi:uncharacterized Tic20 family protein
MSLSYGVNKNTFTTALVILSFVIGSSLGIDIHEKCEAAKDSTLYNNLREALNYGLAAGIASIVMLIIIHVTNGNTSIIGALFGLMGFITGGITLGMFYKCKAISKPGQEITAWVTMVTSTLLGGYSASLSMK